jgi:hypothetical protein
MLSGGLVEEVYAFDAAGWKRSVQSDEKPYRRQDQHEQTEVLHPILAI